MADPHFVIDGQEYPIPVLDSFNMDDSQTMYDACGLTLEDLAIDEEDPDAVAELASKTKHPGFIRALMQIAYERGNPGVSKAKARAVIGNSNMLEAFMSFVGEDEESPPVEPQKSNSETSSSPESSTSKIDSSGDASGNGLEDHPAVDLRATGTSELDTFHTPVPAP